MMPRETVLCGNIFVGGLVVSYFNEKQKIMGDENIVCGEAKEICLVIPCCPLSMEWDWVKYALPIQFFRCHY